MNVGLVIIGDEILSGRRADKHLPKAIQLLAARGMHLSWARYCGDERPRLVALLKDSFATQDLVFCFGGIGATPDDHTRQAAAAALDVSLHLHAEAEAAIRAKFGADTTALRLAMGEFPAGSDIIPNPYNGIAGFSIQAHYFLPGFPEMAWPMMEWVLDTRYSHLHHRDIVVEEAIAVFDAHESTLIPLMTELQARFAVTVFSLPSLGGESGRRHIELGAKGKVEAVQEAMQVMRAEISAMGFEWRELVAK